MHLLFVFILETSVICTDGASMYTNCPLMFGNRPQHKVVIHKETFVDPDDVQNHINAIGKSLTHFLSKHTPAKCPERSEYPQI